jgi:ArsR family transcriptional regulator
MSQSAISHQLKLLRMIHLVMPRREGKTIFYQLADEHVKKIFNQALVHVMEEN